MKPNHSPLLDAADAWRKQPARARKEALDTIRFLIGRSRGWATYAFLSEHMTRHTEDAAAYAAVMKLLRAAQKGAR